MAWLAEWHNYAECKIWKLAQRNKLNWKACARHCRAFFGANLSEQLLYWFTHIKTYLRRLGFLKAASKRKHWSPVNIVRRDQNKYLCVWFFASSKTVGTENVTPSIKNFVALLPWFRDCHFDSSVSSNVRCATCSHGTDCHAESPAGKVQCFKMAKIDPVSPFNPILWLKKAILQRKNLQDVRKTSL